MESKYENLLKAINEYEGTEAFKVDQITERSDDGEVVMVEVGNVLGKVRAIGKRNGTECIITVSHKTTWGTDWEEEEPYSKDSSYLD